jgi:predicted RNA-binding protein with PIN domain
MPYLIDGHNLIHYMEDIRLGDPNDEAELVIKLRGFCARRKKKAVVIFDQGLPGGQSQLSTPSVKVIFASYQQTTADRIIRERIRDITDIKGWIVVSSDNEVLEDAEEAGLTGMRCSQFAELLNRPLEEKPHPSENPNLRFSEKEVDEWLGIFGLEDEGIWESEADIPPASPIRKAVETPKAPEANPPKAKPVDEVDEWLGVFGEESVKAPTEKAKRIIPHGGVKPIKKADPEKDREVDITMKASDLKVSENSVAAWLEVFGDEDREREPTDPAFQRDDPEKQGRYKNKDGKYEPTVHKRMATSEDIHLNRGEVDAWMDVFGYKEKDEDEK